MCFSVTYFKLWLAASTNSILRCVNIGPHQKSLGMQAFSVSKICLRRPACEWVGVRERKKWGDVNRVSDILQCLWAADSIWSTCPNNKVSALYQGGEIHVSAFWCLWKGGRSRGSLGERGAVDGVALMTLMLCEILAPVKGSNLIGNSSGSLGGWPWLVSFNDPFPQLVPQAVNKSQGAQRFPCWGSTPDPSWRWGGGYFQVKKGIFASDSLYARKYLWGFMSTWCIMIYGKVNLVVSA